MAPSFCAPEIVATESGYYIAALKTPALDGIQVAPLTWAAK